MCLFMGKWVKGGEGSGGGGGGGVFFGIEFGYWGKISTGTLSCLLLQLQYVIFFKISLYFVFLYLMYYIFLCVCCS